MVSVPDVINAAWIGSLQDSELLDVESQLHDAFNILDRKHRLSRGSRYTLMRGPPDLVTAWDRWSRLAVAVKNRALQPHKRTGAGQERS